MSFIIIPKEINNPKQPYQKSKERAAAVLSAHRLIDMVKDSVAWQVEISPYVKARTDAQNRYYHGVALRMICDETGHDLDEMKAYLMGERFGWIEVEVRGELIRRPARTTSQLNTQEFGLLIDWTQSWAAKELGLYIPNPGEVVM
jgi:hypothetical protein